MFGSSLFRGSIAAMRSIYKKGKILKYFLKWSFTYKQHAWEPPQNHGWKFDLWPLQTEILKIKADFAKKNAGKSDATAMKEKIHENMLIISTFSGKTGFNFENFGLQGSQIEFSAMILGGSSCMLFIGERPL